MEQTSPRTAGLTAGVGLLLMALLAGVGYGVAVGGLVTPGDASRTAADIAAHETLFRVGVVCLVAVVALDVVVGWALYVLFLRVDAGLSLLAAAFRWVYAAVFLTAISRLVEVPDLAAGGSAAQALAATAAYDDIWAVGLAIFGVHLVLVGVLAWRSGFVPRVLGALVVVAGLGYAFDSVAGVLSRGTAPQVAAFTFAGEVLLALWLLLRSHRLPPAPASPDRIVAPASPLEVSA